MFLMRFAPIIPYNVLNYLVGVTSVSTKNNISFSAISAPLFLANAGPIFLGNSIILHLN